ncbi:hypothetical protein Cfor_05729 [Coptotermes formosanus]|uniref:Uncharacterized protein n=1 Tax=Coptotermes formosanus TaxID=36987 RepID=A0A6L2Q595_COPFO|nr:hypothetical protein Cfor_05729 [Coptotermes formosanus]
MRPVPHSEHLPVHPPTHLTAEHESEHEAHTEVQNDEKDDPTFKASTSSCEHHLLTQGDLNDLVQDLKLSKNQAELLGSMLKGWNLLQNDTKMCFFRNRQDVFQDLYSEENDLVYCNNICTVMDVLGHEHKTTDWRLFIDSSKTSLKVVLLHNGNKFPSVPLAYATNMKETYENTKILLEKIQYDKYCWTICCDLKVTALLMADWQDNPMIGW